MNEKFDKAIAEQRRRELEATVERARNGEGGFSEVHGDLIEDERGVPDHIREREVGAGWVDSAEDHAADN